jgi:hypothetical protein
LPPFISAFLMAVTSTAGVSPMRSAALLVVGSGLMENT